MRQFCFDCSAIHFWQPRPLQQSPTQLLYSPDIIAGEIPPCLEQENQNNNNNNNGVDMWTGIFLLLMNISVRAQRLSGFCLTAQVVLALLMKWIISEESGRS